MIIPKNLLVFDIETIRDRDLLASVKGRERDTFEDIMERERKRLGKESIDDVFVAIPYHRVVCISCLEKTGDKRSLKSWYGPEGKVLETFWTSVGVILEEAEDAPYIITFNGKRFDIPVITIRTLRYLDSFLSCREDVQKYIDIGLNTYFSIEDRWESKRPNYTSKYSRFNIDLTEYFGFGASLEALCKICGIPVKSEGRGSEVERYYLNGEYERIARYCAEDVRATYALYLRVLLMRHPKGAYEEIRKELKNLELIRTEIKKLTH